MAIHRGDARLVLRLLDHGALPHLDSENLGEGRKSVTYIVCFQALRLGLTFLFHNSSVGQSLPRGLERAQTLEKRADQPVNLALRYSDQVIALEPIKRGVDINTMKPMSREALLNDCYHVKGKTILDIVRGLLKSLRNYSPPSSTSPEIRRGIDETLVKFKEGTWQHAAVRASRNVLKASYIWRSSRSKGGRHVAQIRKSPG